MPRRPISLNSDNSNTDRPEPRLLRAVEANSIPDVQDIIQQAKARNQCTESFLSVGLVRACDKNLIDAARFLLSQGANPDYTSGNKPPSLLRAAEYGLKDIAATLIDHDANLEARDKKGRTPLMTAAWRGHMNIVQVLLTRGANIDTVDLRRRNVLHNVAADKGDSKHPPKAGSKPRRRCGMEIVQYLLQAGVNVEAEDELGRTALHWTCVTDHEDLMKILLTTRFGGASPKVRVDPRDNRDKTPLHLAAANGKETLAKFLLEHGADVQAKSDGGWTALHGACTNGSRDLVQILLEAHADVNSELLNGRTPLHVAAEFGNKDAAECLLVHRRCRRDVKDRFGTTPLLMAAQHGRREIAEILAPWNHLDDLSRDEIEASRQFNATIVDFGNFRNENRVLRRSVFELLYARDPNDRTKHSISTLPKNVKSTNFRWIHLPANNIAWCDALLTKRFIEEGGTDIEGYKALATSFNHQHRGQQHHSRFMRPMCQAVQRATADFEESGSERAEAPVVLVTEPAALETVKEAIVEASAGARDERQRSSPAVSSAESPKAARQQRRGGKQQQENAIAEASEGSGKEAGKSAKPGIQRKETSSTVAASESSGSSKGNRQNGSITRGPKSPRKPLPRKESSKSTGGITSERSRSSNIFLFLPYLHFETDRRRREMQNVLENPDCLQNLDLSTRADEVLFRAHLAKTNSFLHVRRTLDQFFYHNIDTRTRDCDQVVFRFQQKHHKDPGYDPKIFMVDQLWMWILGKDLVVTSFPQRWRQPRNDPLNVLEGIIEDINSKTRDPVQNVYELAMTIAGRCFGTFDRHRKGDDDFQFLDMFEASIGAAMDGEATLFQEFSQASRQASEWLQSHQRPNRLSRNLEAESKARHHAAKKAEHAHDVDEDGMDLDTQFVDKLLDVGSETDLLAEIKDIRDELDIIRMVLAHQDHLLPELREAIKSIYRPERSHAQLRKLDKVFEEQEKTISNPLKDINRMDQQAQRIYESIRDLLDLKQKHANAFEARFARDQAAGTQRQGQTVMVFTIVTVIFLPLSFIAAVFAINIEEFPHNPATGNAQMSWGYVAKWIFGVGLAISIPCIALALTVDEMGYAVTEAKRRLRVRWWERKHRRGHPEAEIQLQTLAIEREMSVARKSAERGPAAVGGRVSFEMGVLKRGASVGVASGGRIRRDSESVSEGLYGTRRLSVWDLERGKGRRREAIY